MNERIRELKEQAMGWVPNMADPDTKIRLLNAEKFAELIVRECASICELNGHSYKHSFTPAKARLAESTSNHCGLMIKKHFGVEQ